MAIRVELMTAAALGAFALTSCSGGGSGNTSATAAPAAGAYSMTPGNYETTIRITELSLQGVPAEMQQNLERMRQQPITQTQCLPIGISMDSMNLRNLRFTFPNDMGGCNIAEMRTEGGTMSGSMSCEVRNLPQGAPDAPRAMNGSLTFNGTYSPNTYNATMEGQATEPGNDSRRGNIKVEMSSRRTGDCPAQPAFSPTTTPPPTMMPVPSGNETVPDDATEEEGASETK